MAVRRGTAEGPVTHGKRPMRPRLVALSDHELSPEQRDILVEAAVPLRGDPYNIYRTLVRYPDLFRAFVGFSRHAKDHSTLVPRDRELVILRVGWLCGAAYEWVHHCRIAESVGLTPTEIGRIPAGPDPKCWTRKQCLLLQATDELVRDAFLSDEIWAELTATYSESQVVDLIMTVGCYVTVCMFLNSIGVEIEPEFADPMTTTPGPER